MLAFRVAAFSLISLNTRLLEPCQISYIEHEVDAKSMQRPNDDLDERRPTGETTAIKNEIPGPVVAVVSSRTPVSVNHVQIRRRLRFSIWFLAAARRRRSCALSLFGGSTPAHNFLRHKFGTADLRPTRSISTQFPAGLRNFARHW